MHLIEGIRGFLFKHNKSKYCFLLASPPLNGHKSAINGGMTAMSKKTTCKGKHEGHLCVLASQEKFDTIKELTRNPQYICFNCGRVANEACNLCNPMPNR